MIKITLISTIFLFLFAGQVSGALELINGAGATFPYPLYSKWFSEYNKLNPNVRINYQSIGSGAGIKQLISRTVDFGASDAPMKDEELTQAGSPVIHIPTVLGAVVVSYNIPGLKGTINLTPAVLTDIYLGKIKKWNDPALVAINKTLALPDLYISPTYRSDGSGTTSVFTDYLAKVSENWAKNVGAGKAVKWPVGLGGKGNEGVSALIKQTPGSIGYVEQVYAITNKLAVASLQNQAGQYVLPSLESVSAAAEGYLKTMPEDFRVSITNAPGAKSYPISAFTYILVYQELKASTANELIAFLKWSIGPGQKVAKDLAYAPLPKSLADKVQAKIQKIKAIK